MKMNHFLKTPLALTTVLLATTGYAQESYVGVSYGSIDYEESGDSLDLDAVNFKIGNQFNKQVAGELRVGFGITDDDFFGDTVKIDTLIGAYARVNFANSNEFKPYLIGGFTQVELEVESPRLGTFSADETDVSYGLGADLSLSDTTNLNLEYMQYLDKNGAEIGGLNIGISTRF